MRLRKAKTFIGILLIMISLLGLFFWELKGRDAVMMQEVLVAKTDIQIGEKVKNTQFSTVKLPKESVLKDALKEKDLSGIQGKVSTQLILKNSQISVQYFRQDQFFLDQDESIFVLQPEWISMRSSSLRRGDLVDIYGADERGLIGTYRVAFVKDSTEREIRDTGTGEIPVEENKILNRTDSTSTISHIEIIATIEEYAKIRSCIEGEIPTTLIIVQRSDRFDS